MDSSTQLVSWQQFIPGPIEKVNHDWGAPELFIKRLDLIRSWASGNKYYKLKYSIAGCIKNGIGTIVSKGGMFSNHLEALAKACAYFNLRCICIIRSYGDDKNNPTIQKLRGYGAHLIFLDPSRYNPFDKVDSESLYPGALFIPEGGADENGIRGAADLYEEIGPDSFSHLIIAGGSMSTAAGIISAADAALHVIIVSAWKGCTREFVEKVLKKFSISAKCQWELWPEYHFGGFGKSTIELADFMYSFTEKTQIPLDPVYTGKMMFAIREKIKSGYFAPTDKIIAIHTGGLQGIKGAVYKNPLMWNDYLIKIQENNMIL